MPRRQPASQLEGAQHELKENGPERCLTRAQQDENLIESMRLQVCVHDGSAEVRFDVAVRRKKKQDEGR